ncbi:uncharacterized protein LOC132790168 [Drosophila nasuta]|uniref:uncharacterized protein LOC132790168 n=1 Tax=Drosophila nasuta TaxID=42062 RepID=UPI00295ED446|nr:uncharacterized protein LOC132790168 [Drosophila nasuta]
MSLSFKKEVQWLTTVILPSILKSGRLLDNYDDALANTFNVRSIEINIIGHEEAYMLTLCYRATINFDYNGEEFQRKVIVKKTPSISEDLYASLQFDDLFNNEVSFYTEILPILQKLSNGKFAAAKYYYSEIHPNSAVLILGDFAADGWSITKDRVGLTLEHAQIAVKYLGKFHGFGYAMKHNQKELFDSVTSKLREARFSNSSVNSEWEIKQRVTVKRAAKAIKIYHPQVDKEFIKKFQQLTYSYIGYGRQLVAPREPLAILCHGDFLRNNVAYKYDTDSNGKPLEIMMFDYQTMRLCSPMIDLALFLALSLFADVRYKHFNSLFDDYCNALFNSYKKYSSHPLPDYLNRENLLKEYIRFLPYAVFTACYFLMDLVAPSTTPENFNIEKTEKEIIENAENRGGEIVNRELAHQLMELSELSRLHNVQIDDGIDMSQWIKNVK